MNYFPLFLNPVLKCLEDSDSKVRYYSSEALYNIAKAAHSGIINYFDRFFYALCQLFADVDTDVKKISFSVVVWSFTARSVSFRSSAERDRYRNKGDRSFKVYSTLQTVHHYE